MNSLQAHRIQKTGSIAHDHSTIEVILREGPVAAFRDTLGTVRKERTAFKNLPYIGMGFEFLKFRMGIEPGVEIIQTDNEADRHTSLGHVVNKSAAELFVPQRPSHRVDDASASILLFGYIPHFFHTDREHLWIPVFVQVEPADQLLCQRASGTFSQNRDLRSNIDARLEVALRLAVLIDAFVAGSDTHYAIVFDQQIGSGKTGKEIHTALFNLLTEPPCEFIEGHNVIAVIPKWRRNDRKLKCPVLGQKQYVIFVHCFLNRCALFLPIRHQFVNAARVHDSARDNMRADLFAFFEDGNRKVFIQLTELISGRQSCRPSADNEDIDFESVGLRHNLRLTRKALRRNTQRFCGKNDESMHHGRACCPRSPPASSATRRILECLGLASRAHSARRPLHSPPTKNLRRLTHPPADLTSLSVELACDTEY